MPRRRRFSSGSDILPLFDGWQPAAPPLPPSALPDPVAEFASHESTPGGPASAPDISAPLSVPADPIPDMSGEETGHDMLSVEPLPPETDMESPGAAGTASAETDASGSAGDSLLLSASSLPSAGAVVKDVGHRSLRPAAPTVLKGLSAFWEEWVNTLPSGGRRPVVALVGDWSVWKNLVPAIGNASGVEWHIFIPDGGSSGIPEAGEETSDGQERSFPAFCRQHLTPYGQTLFPSGFFDVVWLLPSASGIPLTIGEAFEVFAAEGPEVRQLGKALRDVRPGGLVVAGLGSVSDQVVLRGKSLAARCLRVWGADWRRLAGRGGGVWAGCREANILDPRLALRTLELPPVREVTFGSGADALPSAVPSVGGPGAGPGSGRMEENRVEFPAVTEGEKTGHVYEHAQAYLALRSPAAWKRLVEALGELAQDLGVAAPFGDGEKPGLSVAACRAVRRHLLDAGEHPCRPFVLRLVRAWERDPDFTLCRGEGTAGDRTQSPWKLWIAEHDRNGQPIDHIQLARQMGVNPGSEAGWLKELRESGHLFYDPVRHEYVGPRTLTLFRGADLWLWFTHHPEWQAQYPAEWNCLKSHLAEVELPPVTLELGSNLLPVEMITGYLTEVAARHGKAFQARWVQFSMIPGRGREVRLGAGAGMTSLSGVFGFSVTIDGRSLALSGRVVLRALLTGRTPLLYERLERQYARLVSGGAPRHGLADAFAALEAHLAGFQAGFREWFASRPEHAAWQSALQKATAGLRSIPPASPRSAALPSGTVSADAGASSPAPTAEEFPGWQLPAFEKVMQRGRLFVARSADEGRVEFFIRLFRELRQQGQVEKLLYVAPKSLLPLYQTALEEALGREGTPGVATGSAVVAAGEAAAAADALFRFHFGDASVLLLSHEALGRLYPGLLPEESGIGEWYYQRLAWSAQWLRKAGRALTPEEMLHLDREYLQETLEHLDELLPLGEAFTDGSGWEETARRMWGQLVDEWEQLVTAERERLLGEVGLTALKELLACGKVAVAATPLVERWGRKMQQYRLVVAGDSSDGQQDEPSSPSPAELVGRFNGRYLQQCLEVAQGALFAFAGEASRLLREIHRELGEVSLLDVFRGSRCQVVLDEVDLRLRNLPNQDVGKTVFAGLSGLGEISGSVIGRRVLTRLEVLHRLEAGVRRHVLVLGSNAGMLNSPLEVYNWGKALGVLPPHLESGTDFLFHHVAIGFALERQLNAYAYVPRIQAFLNRESWRKWAAGWMEGVSETPSGASSGEEADRSREGIRPGAVIVTCPLVDIERKWLKELDAGASGSERQLWLQRISLGTAERMLEGGQCRLLTDGLAPGDREALLTAGKIHWLAGLLAEVAQRAPRGWQLVLVDAFAAGLQPDHPFTGELLTRLKALGIGRDRVFLATGTLRGDELARLEHGEYRIVLGSHRFSLGASQIWRPLAAVHIPWVGYTPQSLYTAWRLLTASRERYPDFPSWLVTYVRESVDEYLNKHLFRKLEIAGTLHDSGALGDRVLRELGPVLSELAIRSTQSLEMRELRELRRRPAPDGEDGATAARRLDLARHLLGSAPLDLPALTGSEVALHSPGGMVGGFEVLSGVTPAELGQRLAADGSALEEAPTAPPVRNLGQYWLRAPLDDLLLGHLPPALGGHCLYYGVGYVPVSPAGETFSPEVRRLAAGFRRFLPPDAEGGVKTAVELVLEGWRHILPATDPDRFARLPSGVFGDEAPSGKANWLGIVLKHFAAAGYEPEALRPWVEHLLGDLAEVRTLPVVNGQVFHPWQPTSLTPYAILPGNAAGWYRPVLFVCREFETAVSQFETAGGLSVLIDRDQMRIPPHLVVAVGLPIRGDEAVDRRAAVEAALVKPWEAFVCCDEREVARRLFSRTGAPLPGRVWQVPHLEQVVSSLLSQPKGSGESLARRLPDGTVIPPPAWVAERVIGAWAATGNPDQATAAGTITGQSDGAPVVVPVRAVDPMTGVVAITEDYEQSFAEPLSRSGRLSVEPWVAGVTPGPYRTLALAIDLAVWEGAPDAVRQLLQAFSPAEVKAALTETVWVRWAVTAGWVHAAESSRTAGFGEWWSVRPDGATADLHRLVQAHLGLGEAGDVLRMHTHQLAVLGDELSSRGYPAAAAAVWRWVKTERSASPRRSGQGEAAALLADYVEQHGPPAARHALVPAQTRDVVRGAVALAVWTPSMLNRMERQVLGTGLEEVWGETLHRLGADWMDEVERHRRRLELLFPGVDTAAACQSLDVALWGAAEARWQDFEVRTMPDCLYGPYWYSSGFQTFVAQTRIREERVGNAPLGAELRRLKRDRSVNYVSVLNTGIIIAGGLEALAGLEAARRRWLDMLDTAGEMASSGAVVSGAMLHRLAASFPLVRLRSPVWAEVHRRILSGECWQRPSRELWEQLRKGAQGEPLRSAPRSDALVGSLTGMFPVDWIGWCRPLAWRVGGYVLPDVLHSGEASPALRLTAWRHQERHFPFSHSP